MCESTNNRTGIQVVRVLKIRKSRQHKNFCFHTMMILNGQKDLSHL